MLLIFLKGFREDEDVIEVVDRELVKISSYRMVYYSLEGSWRICQPKRHSQVLEMPISSSESRLPLVACLNTNVGIRCRKVEPYEVARPGQPIPQLGDQGQGVPVLHGLFVQLSVVYAHLEFAVLLGHKKDRVSC